MYAPCDLRSFFLTLHFIFQRLFIQKFQASAIGDSCFGETLLNCGRGKAFMIGELETISFLLKD